MQDIAETLKLIETLLRKYGYGQADQPAVVRDKLASEGLASALSACACLEWWGGSGSIADVYLYGNDRIDSEDQKRDNQELRSALVELAEAMKTNGVQMERAESWANVFRQWRQAGI